MPRGLPKSVAIFACSLLSPMPTEQCSRVRSRTAARTSSAKRLRVVGRRRPGTPRPSRAPRTGTSKRAQGLHHLRRRRVVRRRRRRAGTPRPGTCGPPSAAACRTRRRTRGPRRTPSTPRPRSVGSPRPPTTTGRPASSGRRSTSTAAMNWSRSTCSTQPRRVPGRPGSPAQVPSRRTVAAGLGSRHEQPGDHRGRRGSRHGGLGGAPVRPGGVRRRAGRPARRTSSSELGTALQAEGITTGWTALDVTDAAALRAAVDAVRRRTPATSTSCTSTRARSGRRTRCADRPTSCSRTSRLGVAALLTAVQAARPFMGAGARVTATGSMAADRPWHEAASLGVQKAACATWSAASTRRCAPTGSGRSR